MFSTEANFLTLLCLIYLCLLSKLYAQFVSFCVAPRITIWIDVDVNCVWIFIHNTNWLSFQLLFFILCITLRKLYTKFYIFFSTLIFCKFIVQIKHFLNLFVFFDKKYIFYIDDDFNNSIEIKEHYCMYNINKLIYKFAKLNAFSVTHLAKSQ